MLDHLGETEAAKAVIAAIESACLDATRTRDVDGSATTEQVGDAIAQPVAR
jgi:tartrate dehydrogenase/decarboxylase / D-malate dehydrogenase